MYTNNFASLVMPASGTVTIQGFYAMGTGVGTLKITSPITLQPPPPTVKPTVVPTKPTLSPTVKPTVAPTTQPSQIPSVKPVTAVPTVKPTFKPTFLPGSPLLILIYHIYIYI